MLAKATTAKNRFGEAPQDGSSGPPPVLAEISIDSAGQAAKQESDRPSHSTRLEAIRNRIDSYIDAPLFHNDEADRELLGPYPDESTTGTGGKPPKDVGDRYIAALYDSPLLTNQQERYLFLKYNYLKYKLLQNLSSLGAGDVDEATVAKVEDDYRVATDVRNKIISANLRLVCNVAKKFSQGTFFDRISEGNQALLRAVERFDVGRGNRFSTYATWAIHRALCHNYTFENQHLSRFYSGGDATVLDKCVQSTSWQDAPDDTTLQGFVSALLDTLEPRTRKILELRYGLTEGAPETLESVSTEIGVTKERIRQIQVRAEEQLRHVAEVQGILSPEHLAHEEQYTAPPSFMHAPEVRLSPLEKDIVDALTSGAKSLGELKLFVRPNSEGQVVAAVNRLKGLGWIESPDLPSLYHLVGASRNLRQLRLESDR